MRSTKIRRSTLDELGDLSATPGSRSWAIAVRMEIWSALKDHDISAEHLRRMVRVMREHHGYQHLTDTNGAPFPSFESFCVARQPYGLGYDPLAIDQIIAERKSAQARAQASKTLAPHGGDHKSESVSTLYNNLDTPTQQGTSADYLTARIARDHKDIHERMKAGEYQSVRAAALDAGIIKDRVSVERNPDGFARAIRRHLSEDQIDELIELLGA